MARAFAYERSLAPMLWVLLGLSAIELCLVHLLVALLASRWVALALSAVTIAGMIWLVAAIRSFRRLPVLVDDERVILHAGTIRSLTVPRAAIAGTRGEIGRAEAKGRGVLRLSLLAHPNVVLDLATPIAIGRRRIHTVAHRLDDPAAFLAELTPR